ncbi:MAG: hypothetical protein H6517_04900 [Microthrixaceae bacterium]|nr:hypothetical protein [Microthrixaceae bacterium]
MNTPAEREPLRPGPVAWLFIALGFGVMGTALLGVFREADQADPGNWIPWLVGAAIIHDAIVLPLVLLVGAGFASIGRPGIRVALRWAVAVGAVITLATWPVVRRWGAQPGDPSELPLPAGRNLVVLWAVLLVGAVAVGVFLEHRRSAATESPR